MRQTTINILEELKAFIENTIAGSDEDTTGDQERVDEINQCLKWLVSDSDLAIVSVSKSRKKRNECDYCNGSGAAPFHHSDKCPICKGTGKV